MFPGFIFKKKKTKIIKITTKIIKITTKKTILLFGNPKCR